MALVGRYRFWPRTIKLMREAGGGAWVDLADSGHEVYLTADEFDTVFETVNQPARVECAGQLWLGDELKELEQE